MAAEVEKKMAAATIADPFAAAVAERKPYYEKRIAIFEQYAARTKAAIEAAKAANEPISVVLPDGGQKPGVKGVTTPMDIAKAISASLAKKVVVAEVDGQPWDLTRPLEGNCTLKLFSFDDAEGKDVRGSASGAGYLQLCVLGRRFCMEPSGSLNS